MNYAYARQFDRALDECRRALELDPTLFQAHRIMRWVYQSMGRYDDAFAAYQKEKRATGDIEGEWPVILAQLQAIGGRREEALQTLNKEIAALSVIRENDFQSFEIAIAYELLGARDRALVWLAKSETARATNFNFVLVEPRLASIQSDPRFIELVKKAGLLN